jgi:two-component system phosphate regulon response regulator PhoB
LFAAIAAMVTPPTLDTVLLIEEDPEILGLLQPALAEQGFKVIVAKDGIAGLKSARADSPAAVIIGKLLSDMRSEYVCRELKTNRHTADVPVMILTGAPRGGPRVGAVWPPADVYLSKFYGAEEVIAKLQGMIRLQADRASTPVIFGPLKLNRYHSEIHLNGDRLNLTLTEYKLLALLIEKRGRIVTREILLRDVWGYTRRFTSRTADIHVHRVRTKLGAHAPMLETIHGGGYRLRAEPEF